MLHRIVPQIVLLLASGVALQGETELEKASRFLKAGDTKSAQTVLERVLQADPQNAQAHYQLSGVQARAGQPKQALASIDKAIELQPNKADYHVLRGNLLGNQAQNANMFKALGLAKDGLAALEKAVQLEPASRNARGAMFNWYFNVPGMGGGGLDKAMGFADQTVGIHPALGHYWKALVFQRKKDPGAAQREGRLALAADPRFAVVYNVLGYVALDMKQLDQALADFRKQVELAPEDPNSHDSLGDGLMAKGLVGEAILCYRKALELNPRFWACADHLGTALERAGQREEAIAHYRRYLQLGTQEGAKAVVSKTKERMKQLGVTE